MKYVLLLIVIMSFSFTPISVGCLQMDIMLVGDFSSSVEGYEDYVTKAFEGFVDNLDLSENGIKVGVVRFSTRASLVSPLSSDKEELKKKIRRVGIAYGSTDMVDALMVASDQLLDQGRPGYRKMIILITDGVPDSPEVTQAYGEHLKAKDINICGIFVKSNIANKEYLQRLCSAYCFSEASYESLVYEINRLNICL